MHSNDGRRRSSMTKHKKTSATAIRHGITALFAFLIGCASTASFILARASYEGAVVARPLDALRPIPELKRRQQQMEEVAGEGSGPTILGGMRILVALASYDFLQFYALEEVLDGYLDMCAAGATVDVVVHTSQPWSVALIDLLNTRFDCPNPSPDAGFSLTVSLRSPSVRLNLVDFHRGLFYDRLDDYDLFIYSEDDIRVTPKTAAAYLVETARVQQLIGDSIGTKSSEFNVGIVRYEYNFPPDVTITDKTRAAVLNTTRVYWEHAWRPTIPKSVDFVPHSALSADYIHMQNHHQGMYLATRDLLKAWRDKPGCNFDVVRQRPSAKNKPGQPSEGTQRVWMSSQMLHGKRHCNVQQVIPIDHLGQLSVLHIPNKNYRRVGKKGRIGGNKDGAEENEFGDGKEQFAAADSSLLSAMNLHLDMRRLRPVAVEMPPEKYTGIDMVDDIKRDRGFMRQGADYRDLVDRRLEAFQSYVARGGVMVESDMIDER